MDRKVGPYQLGESLTTLPFGELVAAVHSARSEPLAVLLLDERLVQEVRFRGLLRLEVSRAGGVRHPALARPIEVGEHGGELYVVIERPAESMSLAARQQDGAPLIQALAAGLDAAHGRRLVHGALSPSSVLVGPSGTAALVGIGLLGAIEEAGLAAVVDGQTDDAFMAPEQQGGRRTVASADGYALAVLAASLLPDPPVSVRAVLDRQRADTPTDRYPTCTAFAAALVDALAPTVDLIRAATPGPPASIVLTPPPAMPAPIPDDAGVPVQPPVAPSPPIPWEPTDPVPPVRPPTAFDGAPIPWSPWSQQGETASLQNLLDPPGGAAVPTALEPIPPFAPSPDQVKVTTSQLTKAMLACLERLEQRDPFGDGVLRLAARVPAFERLLDRVTRDGKVGPVPLGIAAAALLAVLLLLVQQVVVAVLILLLVGVLYVVPAVVKKLAGSERAKLEVTHVRGPIRIGKSQPGLLGEMPQIELSNELVLTVSQIAYGQLVPLAEPISVERPVPGTQGTQPEVVAYQMAEVVVSYLSSSRFLFDVRDAAGAVLYRDPRYEGEPGDTLKSVQWGAPGVDRSTPERDDRDSATSASASGQERTTMLPVPPDLEAALKTAESAAWTQVGLIGGIPLVIVLVLFAMGSQVASLVFIFGVIVFMFAASTPLVRARALTSVRHSERIARVEGRATLREYRRKQVSRYLIQLADGAEIRIYEPLHTRLAQDGDRTLHHDPFLNFGPIGEDRLVSEHRLPFTTVTYLPGGLILQIVNPFGAELYLDPAVKPDHLAEVVPRS